MWCGVEWRSRGHGWGVAGCGVVWCFVLCGVAWRGVAWCHAISCSPIELDAQSAPLFPCCIKPSLHCLRLPPSLPSLQGRFKYTPNMCSALGMIAGGTGITPMYQVGGRSTVHVPGGWALHCACTRWVGAPLCMYEVGVLRRLNSAHVQGVYAFHSSQRHTAAL